MSTIKTTEERHWRRPDVFIANFEHISRLFLVSLLLTMNSQMFAENKQIFVQSQSKSRKIN